MIIEKINERFLSVYLLVSGIQVIYTVDIEFYTNNFLENSQFPMMDIMYLVFYSLFVIAGFNGLFFNKQKLTKILIYISLVTISYSGFHYLLTGTLSFAIGIYFQESIFFLTDYRSYGGFSFYYNPAEANYFGVGINMTSLILILYNKFFIERK